MLEEGFLHSFRSFYLVYYVRAGAFNSLFNSRSDVCRPSSSFQSSGSQKWITSKTSFFIRNPPRYAIPKTSAEIRENILLAFIGQKLFVTNSS